MSAFEPIRPVPAQCLRAVRRAICIVSLLVAATAISPAQTYTTLAALNSASGFRPEHLVLVQGFDGNLYGTTAAGGAYNEGTVFRITQQGALTTLYSFCSQTSCPDGSLPWAGLVTGLDGNFYGTARSAGTNNMGTVFKITPQGALTTLHQFCGQSCDEGSGPVGPLTQTADGTLYGMTEGGGTTNGGTIFKITPSGTITTLHSFCAGSGCSGGDTPVAGLIRASNGNFYGTNDGDSLGNLDTLFRMTPQGDVTTVHTFCTFCSDGDIPWGNLVQAPNGNLYGTTFSGGADGGGTVYKVTPAGDFTTLYSFCGLHHPCPDGTAPFAGLVLGTDGDFYGTASENGNNNRSCQPICGTIFHITPQGTLTTLYKFCNLTPCTDGSGPDDGIMQSTDGSFYGVTTFGGTNDDGVVYKLDMGLQPFVESLPTYGKVASKVIILGTNLRGATSVAFHGTAATFTVVSNTEIRATVPQGATTGKITVTTPTGNLTSNVVFRISL